MLHPNHSSLKLLLQFQMRGPLHFISPLHRCLCSFAGDGRYIISRDYLTLKIWDTHMESRPMKVCLISHHELILRNAPPSSGHQHQRVSTVHALWALRIWFHFRQVWDRSLTEWRQNTHGRIWVKNEPTDPSLIHIISRNRFSVWNQNGQSEYSVDLQTHGESIINLLPIYLLSYL